MNRNDLRRAREILGRSKKRGVEWLPWEWINRSTAPMWRPFMVRACKNNCYIVQFFKQDTPFGEVDWLQIQALDGTTCHNWAHFQRIKDELCGEDREAVEIYPPKDEVVDVCNVYHIWVLPAGVRIGFGMACGSVGAP